MSPIRAHHYQLDGVADGRANGKAFCVLQLQPPPCPAALAAGAAERPPLALALTIDDAKTLLLALAIVVPRLLADPFDPERN